MDLVTKGKGDFDCPEKVTLDYLSYVVKMILAYKNEKLIDGRIFYESIIHWWDRDHQLSLFSTGNSTGHRALLA